MKYLFIFFLCLVYGISYSQNFIRGIVLDIQDNPIPSTSVQLRDIDGNKIFFYTLTDSNGKFEFLISEQGKYLLIVSHLSYKVYQKLVELELNVSKNLTIKLLVSTEQLEEVVILPQGGNAKQEGDTIRYNLKSLTSGNEQKLKDVINKLPGLEINDNGKITSNGKVVNDLMVNGKKIFGDNHQLATENMSADMVEGIDLLNNYESFEAIKEIEGSDKIALNIIIIEKYLGKITGNADVYGAYQERYKLHSNLFRFGTKSNVTAIADLNNTGEQALSLKDYVNMSKSIKQDLRNNDASLSNYVSLPSIPDFLLENSNVESKNSQFSSFDFFYIPSSKLSINGFSIFNFTKSNESVFSQKTFLNLGESVSNVDNLAALNRFFFNQTKINIDYKPNKNSLLNYSVIFDPNTAKRDKFTDSKDLEKTSFFDESNNRFNYTFGQQLSYIMRISLNELLSFNAFQEIKNQKDDYKLLSDQHLFDQHFTQLLQNKNLLQKEMGIFAKFTRKLDLNILRLNTGFFNINNQFYSRNMLNSMLLPVDEINLDYVFLDASLMKKIGLFQYRLKAEIRNSYINNKVDKQTVFQFLPTTQLKFAFSQMHSLTFSYNKTVNFPKIENLNGFYNATDFRNLIIPSELPYSVVFAQNNFSLNYFKFDLFHGTVFMVNSSLNTSNQFASTNTISKINYNEMVYLTASSSMNWNSNFSFEQRVSALKSKIKINANYLYSDSYNFINSFENSIKTNFYSIRASSSSNFKNGLIDFEVGLNYSYRESSYSLFNNHNDMKRISPLLNFNGRIINEFRYFIYNSYEKFKTVNSERSFYDLGFKFMYDKPHSKFNCWIEGVNILNLNNPEIMEISSNSNVFSVDVIKRLSGYMGIGVSYSFN